MHHGTGRPDLNALSLPQAYAALSRGGLVRRLLDIARDEDLGPDLPVIQSVGDRPRGRAGDVTTASCIPADRRVNATVIARQSGVAAGLEAVGDVLSVFAPGVDHQLAACDGRRFSPGDALVTLRGPLDEILEVERTLLNLIGRLSGIATLTADYVRELGDSTRTRVYDTRKTTPGLRVLEKYAVRCGGGMCHRMGLHDAMLIKDNHLVGVSVRELPAFVERAAAEARRTSGDSLAFVEVEAETYTQFQALLTLPSGVIDIILLDNFWPQSQDGYTLRDAAALRDALRSSVVLEASGGVRLETIREIAETGIDRISVGALTHQAMSIDVALDIVDGKRKTARGRATLAEAVSAWSAVLERDVRAVGITCVDRVQVVEETASTQDAAADASEGRPGLMLAAGRQSAGRGRLGRAWEDGNGHGVAVTFVLDGEGRDLGLVSLAAGVACALAAERALPTTGPRTGRRRLGIRWPNDLVDRTTGRKLAGVLIETRDGLLLVGIGMNVSQREVDWPDDLRTSAISLAECGCALDRLNVLRLLMVSLDDALRLPQLELIEAWTQRDVLIGADATFDHDGRRITGRVMAVEPTLEILVRSPDGERVRLPAATTTLVHGSTARGTATRP